MAEQNVVEIVLKSIDEFSADLKTIEGRLSGLEKGGVKTQASLDGLTQASKESSKALEGLNTAATVLGATFQPLASGMALVRGGLNAIASHKVLTIFGVLATATIAAAKSAADLGAEYFRLQKQTGLTSETLSALDIAARDNDSSIQELATSLRFFQRNLAQASEGVGEARNLFIDMGLSLNDLKNAVKNPEQALLKFAQRFAAIEDVAVKQRVALQIFGRGGSEVIQVLNDIGTRGIDPFRKKAEEMGLLISKDMVEKGKAFRDAMTDMGTAVQGFAHRIGELALPALARFLTAINSILGVDTKSFQDKMREIVERTSEMASRIAERINLPFGKILKMSPRELGELADQLEIQGERVAAQLVLAFKKQIEDHPLTIDPSQIVKIQPGTTAPDIGGEAARKLIDKFRETLQKQASSIDIDIAKLIFGDEAGIRAQLESAVREFQKSFQEAFPNRTPPGLEAFRKSIDEIISKFRELTRIQEDLKQSQENEKKEAQDRAEIEIGSAEKRLQLVQKRVEVTKTLAEAETVALTAVLESQRHNLELLELQRAATDDIAVPQSKILDAVRAIDQTEKDILAVKIKQAEATLEELRARNAAKGGLEAELTLAEANLKALQDRMNIIGVGFQKQLLQMQKNARDAADSIAKDFVDKFVDFLANANTKGGFKQFFDSIAISFGKTIFTSILQAGLSNLLSKFDLISDTLKVKGGTASLSDLLMDALKQMVSKTPLHDFWVGIFGDSSTIFKDVLSGVDEKLGEKIGDIGSAIDAAMKSIPESSQEGLAAIAQSATGLTTTATSMGGAALALNSSATALNGAAAALMEAAAALKGVVATQANQTGSIALPEIITTTIDTGNRLPPEPVITEEDITGQPSILENPTIEIDPTNANTALDRAMESVAASLTTGADTAARSIEAGGGNISEAFENIALDFDEAGDSLLESSSELTAMLDTNVAETGQALGELGDDATGLSTDFSSLVDPLKRFGDTLLGAGQSILAFIQSITGLDFGGFFGGLGGLFGSSTLAPTTMTRNVMSEVSPIIERDILEQSSGFAEPLLTSGLDNINVSEGLDRSLAVITDSFDQLAPSLQGFRSGLDVSVQSLDNLGPNLTDFSQSLDFSSFDVASAFDDLNFSMGDFASGLDDATSGLGDFFSSLSGIGGGGGGFDLTSIGDLFGGFFGKGGLVYAGRGMTVANQTSPYAIMGGRGMRGMHAIVGEEGDELVARMKPGRPNAESRDNAPIEQTIIIQDNRSRGLTKADMIVTIGDDVIRDGPISKSFKNVIKRTPR